MRDTVIQIDEKAQVAVSKEGDYLTFALLDKDQGMESALVGWVKLSPQKAQSDKSSFIKGIVNPWGSPIPVLDLKFLHGRGKTEMTDTTCIVIFEYFEPYKYYVGIVVEDLSNVFNITGGPVNGVSPSLLRRYQRRKAHSSNRWESN